jgi:hypothetical protein
MTQCGPNPPRTRCKAGASGTGLPLCSETTVDCAVSLNNLAKMPEKKVCFLVIEIFVREHQAKCQNILLDIVK